jgi:hypothetical protein
MPIKKAIKASPILTVLIAGSIIGIITLLTYTWVVAPQTSHLYAAQQYKNMVLHAGQKSEVIKEQIEAKTLEVASLRQKITEVQDHFFSDRTVREFILDLEPISLQNYCNINSLSELTPRKITTNSEKDEKESFDGGNDRISDIISRRIAIGFTGRYDNIIKLLKKFNSYSQRISVSNLSIKSEDLGNQERLCDMIITIYIIKNKETISDENI